MNFGEIQIGELWAIAALCALPGIGLGLLALIVALMPRKLTRQLRHKLADLVLWQWIKGSKISSLAHQWLWREGNGHERGHGKHEGDRSEGDRRGKD